MVGPDGTVTTVAVERHDLVSQRSFDDVLAAVNAGLGHPDFPALQRRLAGLGDWAQFSAEVAAAAGGFPLMVFLHLDIGRVLDLDPDATGHRCVRIIAGNPVTMAAMTRTTAQAAAFAPVTVLVFEAADGVHRRYDTVTSAIGAELTDDAATTSRHLDHTVLTLLASAA